VQYDSFSYKLRKNLNLNSKKIFKFLAVRGERSCGLSLRYRDRISQFFAGWTGNKLHLPNGHSAALKYHFYKTDTRPDNLRHHDGRVTTDQQILQMRIENTQVGKNSEDICFF
jgi:hypothetical protein